MICERRDQDLFFLSQGLVTGLKSLLLKLHLKRCASCQSRMTHFGATSRALRLAVGGRITAGRPSAIPRVRPQLIWALLLMMLLGMSYGAYRIVTAPPDPVQLDPNCVVPIEGTQEGKAIPKSGLSRLKLPGAPTKKNKKP